ncbi:hypothetical protein L9F63_020166, partial [Diploptera punctata]
SKDVPVYNVTSGDVKRVKWIEVLNLGRKMVYENPFEYTVWYPDGDATTNMLAHYFCVIFFHYLPAYLIDFLFLLARQKRFMVRLQNRITTGLEALQYFTMHSWRFKNERSLGIGKILTAEDRNIFYTDNVDLDIEKYILNCILGARVYCMKEPLTSLPSARRHLFIMYCLHCLVRFLFYGFLIWLLVQNVESTKAFLDYPVNFLQKIPIIGDILSNESKNV